jgi:hypothetical protein
VARQPPSNGERLPNALQNLKAILDEFRYGIDGALT